MASTATPPTSRPTAQRGASAPAGGSAQGGLGVSLDPRKLLLQYWPWGVLAGVVGVVLGVGAHLALARLAPRYSASVLFQFTPLVERVEEQASIGADQEMSLFIATQLERMTSDLVLNEAVTSPAVRNETRWIEQFRTAGQTIDVQKAKKELASSLSARRLPSTAIASLRVSVALPQDAATIANAVADTYLSQLRTGVVQDTGDRLSVLKRRLDSIREERRLKEERQSKLFSDDELETLHEASDVENQRIQQLLPRLVQARYSLDQANELLAQYEEMLSLPGGPATPEGIRAEIEEHPIILNKKQRLADLRTSRATARRKYGPNHRVVQRLDDSIAGAEDELRAERERLQRERFTSSIETLRNEIRSLETTVVETTDELTEARERMRELNSLRQEHETLESDIDRLAKEEAEVENRIAEQQDLLQRRDAGRVIKYDSARVPNEREFPKWFLIIPASTMLCVGFTAGVVVLRELLEQRVRGPADLASIPRTRVLGVVPETSEDPSKPVGVDHVVRDSPSGVTAECFRQIRGDLLKRVDRGAEKVVLVTGGMPGSGATSVAVNLAHSCAAAHRRVLLIDANLRRPTLHRLFDLSESPGLGDVLQERSTTREATRSVGEGTLDVLTAGVSPEAGGEQRLVFERLDTQSMRDLIREARERYDVVLIDAPPMIVSSDALLLASQSDGVVLVARAMGEKRGLIARIRNQLNDSGAAFYGVVVNRVRPSAGGYFRSNFRATHDYHKPASARPENNGSERRGKRKRRSKDDDASRPMRIDSLEREAGSDDASDPHDNGDRERRED